MFWKIWKKQNLWKWRNHFCKTIIAKQYLNICFTIMIWKFAQVLPFQSFPSRFNVVAYFSQKWIFGRTLLKIEFCKISLRLEYLPALELTIWFLYFGWGCDCSLRVDKPLSLSSRDRWGNAWETSEATNKTMQILWTSLRLAMMFLPVKQERKW